MTKQDVDNIESLAIAAIRSGLFQDLASVVQISDSIVAIKKAQSELVDLKNRVDALEKINN